jgi:hypothetical protein
MGLGLGGSNRVRCAHGTCRSIPVKGSDKCAAHDLAWRKRRRQQLLSGKLRRPGTPRENRQIFRADVKGSWHAQPWQADLRTIWLTPAIETNFAYAVHQSGLALAGLPPQVVDTLRWAYWRTRLNRTDMDGWQRALNHARRKMAKIGPAPSAYVYRPPPVETPTDPRIKVITRKAGPHEPARVNAAVDRASRTERQRQRLQPVTSTPGFNWQQFLSQHWSSIFGPLFQAHRIDLAEAMSEHGTGYRLAVSWHQVLREREQRKQRGQDGSVGAAEERWHALLRDLARTAR